MAETFKTATTSVAETLGMSIDLRSATSFMTTHARLLDRRRFEFVVGDGDRAALTGALEAYRNPDGGYGWGLEPDLRAPESQPGGALHAFEALEAIAPRTSPRAAELCEWLASVALEDGGLPFALPVANAAGLAPFWAEADPTVSSLQITAYVAAAAHRVAVHDPAIAQHRWLAAATRYCLDAAEGLGDEPHALALLATVEFLDAAHEAHPEAAALLERLGERIPADGRVHVAGGKEDETIGALDFAPNPGRPARALFSAALIAAELERLGGEQEADGGWRVGFDSYSPAATLEWRGYMTVRAVWILSRNSLL